MDYILCHRIKSNLCRKKQRERDGLKIEIVPVWKWVLNSVNELYLCNRKTTMKQRFKE